MTQSALSKPAHAIESIKHAWQGLLERDPKIRTRDAAAILGLSEAQLVACGCGDNVIRLSRHWVNLIEALPSLGYVMALTRNDHAVHEKMGRYCNIRITGNMGSVLDSAIDLRLFLNHWHFGFAVREESPTKLRQSLQFFDSDGTAVHAVYLTAYSVQRTFDRLVETFQAADQSPRQMVKAACDIQLDWHNRFLNALIYQQSVLIVARVSNLSSQPAALINGAFGIQFHG